MSSPPLSNPLAAEIAEFEALLVTLRQLQAENYSQSMPSIRNSQTIISLLLIIPAAAISVLAFDIFLTLGDEVSPLDFFVN